MQDKEKPHLLQIEGYFFSGSVKTHPFHEVILNEGPLIPSDLAGVLSIPPLVNLFKKNKSDTDDQDARCQAHLSN